MVVRLRYCFCRCNYSEKTVYSKKHLIPRGIRCKFQIGIRTCRRSSDKGDVQPTQEYDCAVSPCGKLDEQTSKGMKLFAKNKLKRAIKEVACAQDDYAKGMEPDALLKEATAKS